MTAAMTTIPTTTTNNHRRTLVRHALDHPPLSVSNKTDLPSFRFECDDGTFVTKYDVSSDHYPSLFLACLFPVKSASFLPCLFPYFRNLSYLADLTLWGNFSFFSTFFRTWGSIILCFFLKTWGVSSSTSSLEGKLSGRVLLSLLLYHLLPPP